MELFILGLHIVAITAGVICGVAIATHNERGLGVSMALGLPMLFGSTWAVVVVLQRMGMSNAICVDLITTLVLCFFFSAFLSALDITARAIKAETAGAEPR